MCLGCFDDGLVGNVAAPGDGRAPGSFPVGPLGRTPCQNHFALDDWGERGRPARRFGRRARNGVGQIRLLKGFRRDAENGNRDGRAPPSRSDVMTIVRPFMAGSSANQMEKFRGGRQDGSFVPDGTFGNCLRRVPAINGWAIIGLSLWDV